MRQQLRSTGKFHGHSSTLMLSQASPVLPALNTACAKSVRSAPQHMYGPRNGAARCAYKCGCQEVSGRGYEPLLKSHFVCHQPFIHRQNSEILRSDSPASEAGALSDDKPTAKGKAKSKNKIIGTPFIPTVYFMLMLAIDEAEFDLKRKRVCRIAFLSSSESSNDYIAWLAASFSK